MVLVYRIALVLALGLTACAPGARPGPDGRVAGAEAQRPATAAAQQRTLFVAAVREPESLEPTMNTGTLNREYDALTNAFLTYFTPEQVPTPYLAQDLPSLDTGSWKTFPDGHMETTYTIKKGLTWPDGVALTAHDFVFAHRIRTDPEVPTHAAQAEQQIRTARAIDDHTLFLDWKEPDIWAGLLHAEAMAPLPRHLLQNLYETDKERFVAGPHWRDGYVGSGPYRVESWEPGVEMVLRAHPGFVFGKPPIDQIVMRFIPDGNTIVANMLSGSIDVAFHSSITYAQAQALEESGWGGTIEYWRGNPRFLEFQMRDWGNHQKVVLDRRVRRALLHAYDRPGMVDALYVGKARVHDVWLDPKDPAFPAIDRAITKYEFDPRKSEQYLRDAGWSKGADGVARNAQGEALNISMLNHPSDLDMAEGAILADAWKGIGVQTEIVRLAPAQMRDGELRAKFPGVAYNRRGLGYDDLVFTTNNFSTPENRWTGQNRNGYSNPIVDQYIERALATINPREREPFFVEAFKAWTEDAAVNVTHLQPRIMAYPRGLVGSKEAWVGESGLMWNSWEWHWTDAAAPRSTR